MVTLPNKAGSQPTKPLEESLDIHEKKRKLEADIKTKDSLHNSLTESAARRDIETYKNRREATTTAKVAMLTEANPNEQI